VCSEHKLLGLFSGPRVPVTNRAVFTFLRTELVSLETHRNMRYAATHLVYTFDVFPVGLVVSFVAGVVASGHVCLLGI
jgi:hypothetical protein